jgi:hypothetical protein
LRVLLAVPIAFLVFTLCTLYAENTYVTGLATLLAFLFTLLPLDTIKGLLIPPPRGADER